MKIEMKWGVIFAVVSILWLALEGLAGLHDRYISMHSYSTILLIIPAVFMIYLAIRDKRETLGGTITFKPAFLCGMLTSLSIAIFPPLAQWIVFRFIPPQYFFPEAPVFLEVKLVPNVTDHGVAIWILEDLRSLFDISLLVRLIVTIAFGGLTSLILAAFMRTKTT